jgi:hypothetical protein
VRGSAANPAGSPPSGDGGAAASRAGGAGCEMADARLRIDDDEAQGTRKSGQTPEWEEQWCFRVKAFFFQPQLAARSLSHELCSCFTSRSYSKLLVDAAVDPLRLLQNVFRYGGLNFNGTT